VVYLDADIRVNGDISRLFELDLGNFPFAARPGLTVAHNAEPGTWRRRYLEMMNWDETVPYGSAGVLIINPSKWLEMDLGSRVIEFVRDNQEICKLADETALNMQVRGQFVPISPIWNMITSLWLSEELNDLLDPIVLHHGGAQKPWSPMKWYTVTGDVEESKIYDSFFSETDCPVPVSEAISWKDRKRYFRRVVQHRLLGQKIDRRDLNLKKFRDHIQNFEFSDIEQGLTSFNDAGLLTLVHRC
jgi:lipopolysaccharide biosynthesis glycosyltransferase